MKVFVDISEYKDQVNKLKKCRSDYNECLAELRSHVSDITSESTWCGADTEYYRKEMTNFVEQCSNFGAQMLVFNDFLDNYIKGVEQLDEAYGSKKVELK